MIRWGILGAANIARKRVIPAIQRSTNGRVTAIASRDPGRARSLATGVAIDRVHASYEALLADPDIDAIYNPLPNSEHCRWTLAAVAAGKHVLCEKPLALNAAEAEEMVAAAKTAGVVFAEAFMYRFHPRVTRLLELIAEGAIGDVHLIRSTFTFGPIPAENIRLNHDLGGGALMDVGCYGLNFARLVSGREPDALSAVALYGRESRVDETFAAVLRFGHDLVATFDASVQVKGGPGFEVLGTGGKIVGPQGFLPEPMEPSELHIMRGTSTEVLTFEPVYHYQLMVEDFAEAIATGRPVRFAPEDAVANMRAIDALKAAAESHGMKENQAPGS